MSTSTTPSSPVIRTPVVVAPFSLDIHVGRRI
jgi:hypothetical protein